MTYPTGSWNNTAAYRPRVSDAHLLVAWLATVFTLGYLLPWAVAATRRKSNTAAIGLLTFFAGWTAVGWLVALVMACTAEPAQGVYLNIAGPTHQPGAVTTPPGWYPDGAGGTRYWDGSRWAGV